MTSSKLVGVVDLGTFAIRFSITSLNPRHARILPVVFQDKAPVSLMRGSSVKIEDEEIEETLTLLLRFKNICEDYGVAPDAVRVAANAQEAPNAEELFTAIEQRLEWPVLRLSEQLEAWAAVYGVASSFYRPRGAYIEIHPTVAYFYWVDFEDDAEVAKSPIEIPYPALNSGTLVKLTDKRNEFRNAFEELIARELGSASRESVKVYLSSTGFSGMHNILMALLGSTPMPLSSGLEITADKLLLTHGTERATVLDDNVVAVLHEFGHALGPTTRVLYCRHNIRDGLLFQGLSKDVRAQDPLIVATQPYALPGAAKLAHELAKALPPTAPKIVSERLVRVLSQAAYIHSSYPKAMQAATALTVGITGVLSGTHGITHEERALLGLALCNRWGGELNEHYRELRQQLIDTVLDRELAWWALYLGLVLYLLGGAYPGANVRPDIVNLTLTPHMNGIRLHISIPPTLYGNNAVMRQRLRQLPARIDALEREFGNKVPRLSISLT